MNKDLLGREAQKRKAHLLRQPSTPHHVLRALLVVVRGGFLGNDIREGIVPRLRLQRQGMFYPLSRLGDLSQKSNERVALTARIQGEEPG